MCARSCTHIYDVRKRKGVVVYLNVNNNNDIQNNDIYNRQLPDNFKTISKIYIVCAGIYFDLKKQGVLPQYCLSTKGVLSYLKSV